MAVIVKYDEKGNPYYRSAKGVGSTDVERTRANQLDNLLKKEIKLLEKRLSRKGILKKGSKGNVAMYWELGHIMRKIFYESGMIDESEKHLYWLNTRMHVPEILMAKDRGPNRLHLEYCFRLAGFPKGKAMKMKWGKWVYLFDSPGINREQRFDKWLKTKMNKESVIFTRENIRILAQSINKLLGNIETNDLSDEQLIRCYEAAWSIKEIFTVKGVALSNNQLKEALKKGIEKNYIRLGEVIEGTKEPAEFATLVASELTAQ